MKARNTTPQKSFSTEFRPLPVHWLNRKRLYRVAEQNRESEIFGTLFGSQFMVLPGSRPSLSEEQVPVYSAMMEEFSRAVFSVIK